jgi:hypothetical protein
MTYETEIAELKTSQAKQGERIGENEKINYGQQIEISSLKAAVDSIWDAVNSMKDAMSSMKVQNALIVGGIVVAAYMIEAIIKVVVK